MNNFDRGFFTGVTLGCFSVVIFWVILKAIGQV